MVHSGPFRVSSCWVAGTGDQASNRKAGYMFGSKFLSLICICCALAGSGCATIVSPGPDYVFVTSAPNGATVTIDGIQVGQTPLNASINRRASTIAFSKTGYQTVTAGVPKEFNGWVVGNVFIGGIIGLIIDAVSENIMKVSGTISANLPKLESGDSQGDNGPDSIAAWLGRARKYAELAQANPPERE